MKAVYPWHQTLLDRLATLLEADQLPNAIALTGPPGWGLEQLLADVSLLLLEFNERRSMETLAHPDFRWVVPEGVVIKIDAVRKLNDFAVQTSQMAPRKVAALSDAHLLNTNAANALLKTLEEPPPNTHLVLATPFWGKLLPTIRSRCQRFQMHADPIKAKQWLVDEGLQISARQFAEYGYAPLAAQAATAQTQLDLDGWLNGLSTVPLATAIEQLAEIDAVGWLARWYRRILLHMQGEAISGCNTSHVQLLEFSDQLLSARRQIEFSNAANVRLLQELLIVRWLQLMTQNPPQTSKVS